MNWMTIVWPMMAAACLTLALMHLRIAWGADRRGPHVLFAIAAISVAVISGFELVLLRTIDLERYQSVLRWAVVPIWIMVASVGGFVRCFFGTGNKWLLLTAVSLNGLAQIANLTSAIPAVRSATAIHQQQTFGGVSFSVPTIVNGPWNIVELASVGFMALFIFDASLKLWRRGERRRAAIVGGAIILFFFAARGHAILVENGLVNTPYLVSFAFLGVLIAMGHELSTDVLNAARLTRELRESEQHTDLAARAAALGFWTWDVQRDEIWASANAREIFGISADEKVNLPRFLNLVHPEHQSLVQSAIKKSLNQGEDYEAEYRVLVSENKARWISARGRIEFDLNHKPATMSGVVVDITDRRQAELELQQMRGQLAHAGRVSVLGQLAAAMAHELNQPLGAILRNAEAAELFLNQNPPAFDEVRDIVADIRRDDQRAAAVIDGMRSLLQQRHLQRQALNLHDLASEVVALTRSEANVRRVEITMEIPRDLPAVKGDRIHLQQVLLNLIVNAMDALEEVEFEKRRITVNAQNDGENMIRVEISDSGHGIPADKLPRLFHPFFTTKSDGMGMGLSISRTIIDSHGGRIWAENRSDGGARFCFTLPLWPQEGDHE